MQAMKPEVYVAAIGALNGDPYEKWAKGLTAKQLQMAVGIAQRADQDAKIMMPDGKSYPASGATTVGPTDFYASNK